MQDLFLAVNVYYSWHMDPKDECVQRLGEERWDLLK